MALPVYHPLQERMIAGASTSVANGVAGVIRAPFKGRILQAGTMIGSTVASADATCTLSIAGTAVTGGNWIIATSGSAIGDLDFAAVAGANNSGTAANTTITGANTCNEDDLLKFAFTGSGTGGGTVYCYAVIVPT